jgi:hypothetical protein
MESGNRNDATIDDSSMRSERKRSMWSVGVNLAAHRLSSSRAVGARRVIGADAAQQRDGCSSLT